MLSFLSSAATFARPSGNITGFMLDAGELNAERFELLEERCRRSPLSRSFQNPTRPRTEADLAEATQAARSLELEANYSPCQPRSTSERSFRADSTTPG